MVPTGLNIVVRQYTDVGSNIVTPDSAGGQLFEVTAVGEGFVTDNGVAIPLEVQPGDIVALEGVVKGIPFRGMTYGIARGPDVLCYYRANGRPNPSKCECSDKLDIPDKV